MATIHSYKRKEGGSVSNAVGVGLHLPLITPIITNQAYFGHANGHLEPIAAQGVAAQVGLPTCPPVALAPARE